STYYYDPFGRRLWKEINGIRTYFVYADEGLVAETDAAGNVVKSYGYRPGSTWTTDPLFLKVGGQYYF
ncbi:Rhs-family protein, partial [Olavius sp. associated proteobacterium Delta 1]